MPETRLMTPAEFFFGLLNHCMEKVEISEQENCISVPGQWIFGMDGDGLRAMVPMHHTHECVRFAALNRVLFDLHADNPSLQMDRDTWPQLYRHFFMMARLWHPTWEYDPMRPIRFAPHLPEMFLPDITPLWPLIHPANM